MQAQLGAASGRQLLPSLTLPSLCLNGDLIIENSQRNLCAGACRGLRANTAHGRVGAMAVQHLTLSRAGPHGSKLAGRSRPGMEK